MSDGKGRGWAGVAGGYALSILARMITAPRRVWHLPPRGDRLRIYAANHTSNADTVLLWSCLPPDVRRDVRPVAAADYWTTSPLRRFIGGQIFDAVLIPRPDHAEPRAAAASAQQAMALMGGALEAGSSLILFPEGTRNMTGSLLGPLKAGIWRLAAAHPEVEVVPCWIDNLNAVMPKGEVVPVPLICTVTFGPPLTADRADKARFMEALRAAMLALSPGGGKADD